MKKIRFFIFFLLLFGFIASCGSEIGSSDEDTITIKKNNSTSYRDLLSKAQSQGSVRVIVKLKMPFTPEGELSSPSQVASQRAQIKSAQTELLNSLSNYNIKGVKRFETIPYISMEVDAQTLCVSVSHPLVESIHENTLMHIQTSQKR